MRNLLDEIEHRLALVTRGGQRKAEQDGDQQHLQDVALGKGVDEGVGNDVEDELDRRLGVGLGGEAFDGLGVQRGKIGIEAGARLGHVGHHQADHQRKGGYDLEVEQRLAAHPADFLHVLHAGDAVHHGAEDHRGDDHFDEFDETVAEGLEIDPHLGLEIP